METNVKILKTVVDKLEERWSETAGPNYSKDEDDLGKEVDALRQDIKYSIDMINTIIDIETKTSAGSGITM